MFARPTLRMIARSAAPSHLRRTVARTYVNDASQSTAPAKAVSAVLVGAAGYSLYESGDAAQKTEELLRQVDAKFLQMIKDQEEGVEGGGDGK